MLSVIVDAREAPERLPALLAQLTSGAVEGLVREVILVAQASPLIEALCDDMGAERADSLAQAAGAAACAHLLFLPAALRLRDGWIESLRGHLAAGGQGALVQGLATGGLFRRAPAGVLVERGRLGALDVADLDGLRRRLGLKRVRIG